MTPEGSSVDLGDGVRAQLGRVVELMRECLDDSALAAYLYGSAVLGGLKAASDLDVLAVTSRPATAHEKRALVEGLLPISGRHATAGPSRPLELTVAVQSDVRPWRYPPRVDFQYGDWMRDEFERGDPQPWHDPDPDLAVLLTMVRQRGRPLFGPPATDLLDPVPFADLVRSMLAGIDGLLGDLEPDTRNVVLTLARIWTTLATGEIRSKDAAADWALERLPPEQRAVLARARAIYLGDEPERWDDLTPLVRRHAEHLVSEVRAAAANR